MSKSNSHVTRCYKHFVTTKALIIKEIRPMLQVTRKYEK